MQYVSEVLNRILEIGVKNMGVLVNLGVSVLGTVVSLKIAGQILDRITKEGRKERVHILIGRQMVKASIVTIGVIGFLSSLPSMGGYAKTLLAGSSILMAALGFAAQEPIANIINGMFITMYRPFEVGDRIKIRSTGLVGLVEDITLRHTVLRTYENTRVLVPNITISRENIENFNLMETRICNYIEFRVEVDTDIELARGIIAEKIRTHTKFIDNRSEEERARGVVDVYVYVKNVEGDGVDLRVGVWSATVDDSFIMCSEVKQGVLERYREEGIELAIKKYEVSIKKSIDKSI